MPDFDWNQLRTFLAAAEAGTLSAAARRLGQSQPTASRQVAALEASLGVTLFERAGKALVLTQAGAALLAEAQAMGAAADRLALVAAGHADTAEGLVSISASDAVAAWVLPPLLRRVRAEAPGLRIEVVSSNALSDLLRREADIAVRHVRPEEAELIGRRLRDGRACFYASTEWVAQHGHPRTAAEAKGAAFISFDRGRRFADHLAGIGLQLDLGNFPLIAENSVVAWEMVRAGLGIGTMMQPIADQTPGVVRVLDALPVIPVPVWLVTHRELRTARRIQVVFKLLAEALG
jgi:DNA-binding transcriptional LysR family regulator